MSGRLEREQSRFDRWARWYDLPWLRRQLRGLYHWALDAVPPAAAKPTRILDVGCGTGRLLIEAARRFPKAAKAGIDLSPRMIEKARRNTPADSSIRFEVASADKLPFPDASFDLAFSTISLHHWPDPVAGVRELARVIRPGGYFVLADFSISGWLGHVIAPLGRVFHHAVYSPSEMRRLLREAGFVVEQQARPHALSSWVMLVSVGRRADATISTKGHGG